ncbi:MAG: hypothetical protein Q8942_19090 [Bacillota bacterium]|nr:hypothetical protein [Bacillota bacterium]
MKNTNLMLTIGCVLCLIIGTLSASGIAFIYIAFTHDLAVLLAAIELWNKFVFQLNMTIIILALGIILGFITKCSNTKKILILTIVGYLLSFLSAYAVYRHIVDFPIQIFLGFLSVLPHVLSFLFLLGSKFDNKSNDKKLSI